MTVERFTCANCGKSCERQLARGQKPKWCSQRCADRGKNAKKRTCAFCGRHYIGLGVKYCTPRCSNDARRKPAPPKQAALPFDQRSPIRAAYEDQDHKRLLRAIRADTKLTPTGCWAWTRRMTPDGYPEVRIGTKYLAVHRLVLEAKYGAPLGSQHAHHTCANSGCVNPNHLQPVTHLANTAEMLARQSYLSRIRELESALAAVAPTHPLLTVIAVA